MELRQLKLDIRMYQDKPCHDSSTIEDAQGTYPIYLVNPYKMSSQRELASPPVNDERGSHETKSLSPLIMVPYGSMENCLTVK